MNQADLCLDLLKVGALSAFDLKRSGVSNPSASVAALRKRGHEIHINRRWAFDARTRRYAVGARYMLVLEDL